MIRKRIKAFSLVLFVLILVGSFILLFQGIRGYRIVKSQFGLSPLSLYQLATDGGAMVKSDDGRVNILLLGIGGGTHEGPDLTDTIIVLSFHLTKKTLALISIPRDIWSDSLKDRVNSAYHYGEAKKEGGGLTLSSIIMEDIVGIPIHYTAVIDFSQFETLIDYIGGIDIVVPTAFTDTEYPIAGKENDECGGDPTYACRYQTLIFEKGLQHMDGKRALMYVRTRHAEGGDGNDFARGRRQQDVIVAVKTKILSLSPWYHPDMTVALFQFFNKATKTDLTVGQLLALGKLGMGIKPEEIQKISIEPYLEEAPVDKYGRYALEPKESFEQIRAFITTSLEGK
jgi:LCP family protein required for cell wall assembly